AFDSDDAHGIRIHRYGPHIFHTNSARVFDYLSRFTKWCPYEHRVLADIGGTYLPFPINRTTVNQLYGLALDEAGVEGFLDGIRTRRDPEKTAEDVVLNAVGPELCDRF